MENPDGLNPVAGPSATSRRAITGQTRLYGIFADPILQVKAPAAFNAILQQRGVDAVFVPLHVTQDRFEDAVAGMRMLGNLDGFTLTIPHKVRAAEICDRLEPIARACGAVNAVRREADGTLTGETFDGIGMARAIASVTAVGSATRVLLVGAGGAARAIAYAIAEAGVGRLDVRNRTQSAADALVKALRLSFPHLNVGVADQSVDDYDVLINATSLGLTGCGEVPFDPSATADHAVIADVVMDPDLTPLLVRARALGRTIVPGRRMLDEQLTAMADFLGMHQRERVT